MLYSQATRILTLTTTLGVDVLLLRGMTATEHLSAPFEYELELVSERPDLRAEELLGTPATVSLQLPAGGHRYFNGYLNRFTQGSYDEVGTRYSATLVPWLWFLSRRSDCRIFQDQTVPDIVATVFRDHGFTDFEARLSASYRPWTYCVQYRESDLAFVSRLLEHEGIYYFHEHSDGKHLLVLADSRSAHAPAPGYATVPFYPPGQTQLREHLDAWTLVSAVRPGAFAHSSYDFTAPRKSLLARSSAPKAHAHAGLEVFDYQGDYTQSSEGGDYARIRLEEAQAGYAIAQAAGDARGLSSGGLFTLSGHPHAEQNSEYLIVAAHYTLHSDAFRSSGAAGTAPVYRCSLSALTADVPYRPARSTPKPTVQGPQTAHVVGKAGEEIWTDQHGRVKVQFHWDRYGQADETSSCWIRVSHPWAGKGWGAVAIPRIGQEVVVDFLEGDPDQPIITGRVYNGDTMPPFGLPAAAVVSGIKSNTHKGSGYNELTMDDTAGKEKITIHGQYDMNTTVEHDQTNTVNNTFTETIKSDAKITVTEGTYSHDVAANTATYHVQAALTETYDATQTTTVKQAITITSTSGPICVASNSQCVNITAATEILLQVGASTLQMNSAGQIKLSGVDIAITGSAAVAIAGGVIHSEASAEHQTKGAIVLSEGTATNTVKGGMVMLNP